MKRLGRSSLALAACAIMLLMGCASAPISRIDANRALYESWPIDIQEAVLAGRVEKGMTPDMVRMALGQPTRTEARTGGAAGDEIWIYQKSSGMNLPLPNISVGGNIGGIGVATGGRRGAGGLRQTTDQQEIVFQNGVVARVE